MIGAVSAQSYAFENTANTTTGVENIQPVRENGEDKFFFTGRDVYPSKVGYVYPNGTIETTWATASSTDPSLTSYNDFTDQYMEYDSGVIEVSTKTGVSYSFNVPTDGGDPSYIAVNGNEVYASGVNGSEEIRHYDSNGNILNTADTSGFGTYGGIYDLAYSNLNDRVYVAHSDGGTYFQPDLSGQTNFSPDYDGIAGTNNAGAVYGYGYSEVFREDTQIGSASLETDGISVNNEGLFAGADFNGVYHVANENDQLFNYTWSGSSYAGDGVGVIGDETGGTMAIRTTNSDTSATQISFIEYEQSVNYPQLSATSPPDNEEYPFYTDSVNLSVNVTLNAQTDATIRWFVNGQEQEVRTVSSDGKQTYSHPVTENESYTWNVRVDNFPDQNTEERTFSVLEQQSAFYETTQNFNDEQILVETHSEGLVNLTLNGQQYELQDGTNTYPVENTNFSIRYDLLESEQGTRVENLTFYSVKEEGIIEETTVDISTGEVSESLSADFGQDPEYIDILVEMEELGQNQNDRPSMDWYNLTYTSDEEERSIGFDEYDIGLILMLVLIGVFGMVILKS